MKKFFICAALALSSVIVNAQVVIPVHNGAGLVKKSTEPIIVNGGNALSRPSKAASLDDTSIWGYYLGNNFNDCSAVGVQSTATYYAGYFVPGDGLLKGCSINGVNIPVLSTTYMSNISVWISEDLEENIVTKEVNKAELKSSSFNAVALDEPFAIPETGVYVGVKFDITRALSNNDKFPILVFDEAFTQSLILKFTSIGLDNGEWEDYTNQFGSYAMQLFCSNMTLPERCAYFKSVSSTSTLAGEDISVQAIIASDGSESINSIDYTVEINGTKTSKHADLKHPIAGGLNQTGSVTLNFTAPDVPGKYTANITIDKINGQENSLSTRAYSVVNKVLSRIATRRTVVEEFTGTGCGYCPRGWVGMEYLKEHKENFIGIAFHKYNTSDPMYVANYYPTGSLGISGAPSCAMDRKLLDIDPYYGTGNDDRVAYPTIADDFDECNAIMPDVDVNVSGIYNEDFTAVDITADIEYLIDGDKYTIVYVLTADNLSGTSDSWRQSNYYSTSSPTNDPILSKFCRGGEYASSYVYLTFNDVMIGSSYSTSGVNQAPALKGEVKAGNVETSSYKVSMPTKTTLKEAINPDEVYAVVLLIASDGTIANAARAKVKDITTGIKGITTTDTKEVARYNAAGQLISAPQKGINIVKLSNGKTVKVIVK